MTFLAGTGTGLGRDYTVFATVTGKVHFEHADEIKEAHPRRGSPDRRRLDRSRCTGRGQGLVPAGSAGDHRRA